MSHTLSSLYNVHLRTWNEDDIDGYTQLISDPETMQFISSGATRNRSIAATEIENFQKEITAQGWSRWAISLGKDAPFIGYAGFAKKDLGINFGNRFLKRYWGTPYPFTAIHLALDYGFTHFNFKSIYTLTNIKHTRAIEMNRAFLHEPEASGSIIETPYGPHLKIDLSREKYAEIYDLNRAKIDVFSKRMLRQHAHQRIPTSL